MYIYIYTRARLRPLIDYTVGFGEALPGLPLRYYHAETAQRVPQALGLQSGQPTGQLYFTCPMLNFCLCISHVLQLTPQEQSAVEKQC